MVGHGNEGVEKVTPWTQASELPEVLKGTYGRRVTDEFAWAIYGNIFFVQAFKSCNFTPPVKCYALNLLGGGIFNGTLSAGQAAMGIIER